MSWQKVSLVFLIIIVGHTTIDGRAIKEDTFDQLVDDPTVENEEMLATLSSYRRRFEHSNNMKALRWMFQQRIDAENIYCEMCHILLPVVSEISLFSYIFIFDCWYIYYSFEYSSKLMKQSVSKM